MDSGHGPKTAKIFDFYAYHGHTIDSLREHLAEQGIAYRESTHRFPRSNLHHILRDRSYIGEIKFHDQWYPGMHEPLVNRSAFARVQVLLGENVYQSHDLVYAGELIECGHCGSSITGEVKSKKTKRGVRKYVYYRCVKYNQKGHPRIRLRQAELDEQVIGLFRRLRIEDDGVHDWFATVLRARAREQQQGSQERLAELNRQLSSLRNQQDRLLNLRLLDEIEESTFAEKNMELRDRIAQLNLQVEACDRGRAERAELAQKAFELSQTLEMPS